MKKLFLIFLLTFFYFPFSYSQTGTIKVKKSFSIFGTWTLISQYNTIINKKTETDPNAYDTLTYFPDSTFYKKLGFGNNCVEYTAKYIVYKDRIDYSSEVVTKCGPYGKLNPLERNNGVNTDYILTASEDTLAFVTFPNGLNYQPEKVYYYRRIP